MEPRPEFAAKFRYFNFVKLPIEDGIVPTLKMELHKYDLHKKPTSLALPSIQLLFTNTYSIPISFPISDGIAPIQSLERWTSFT